jgi:hypothetical protein
VKPTGTQSQVAFLQAEAERPVTVALFHQPHEAHLARGRLESEGIHCALRDELMGSLAWPPDMGVRLCVPAWQAEHARRVLAACEPRESSADWVTGELDALRCPRCGSLRVRIAPARSGSGWRLLGLPLPFSRRRAGCRRCAHRWTPA